MRFLLAPLLFAAACASSGGMAALGTDGAWVRTFPADSDSGYDAAIEVLGAEGYTVEWANPIAGSFTATSAVRTTLGWHNYTRARVDVEGGRIRISLVRARERAGGGREPNHDRPVRDRAPYERLFDAIERALAP